MKKKQEMSLSQARFNAVVSKVVIARGMLRYAMKAHSKAMASLKAFKA